MAKAKAPKDPHANCDPALLIWSGTKWECRDHWPYETVTRTREAYVAPRKLALVTALQKSEATELESLRAENAGLKKDETITQSELKGANERGEEADAMRAELAELRGMLAELREEVAAGKAAAALGAGGDDGTG